jgi:hypothetical protein
MQVIVPVYYSEADFTKLVPILDELKLHTSIKVLNHIKYDNADFLQYLSDISVMIIPDDASNDKTQKITVRGQPVHVSTKTSVDYHKKLKYLMYDISLDQLPKELGTIEQDLLPIIHWRMEIEK